MKPLTLFVLAQYIRTVNIMRANTAALTIAKIFHCLRRSKLIAAFVYINIIYRRAILLNNMVIVIKCIMYYCLFCDGTVVHFSNL